MNVSGDKYDIALSGQLVWIVCNTGIYLLYATQTKGTSMSELSVLFSFVM